MVEDKRVNHGRYCSYLVLLVTLAASVPVESAPGDKLCVTKSYLKTGLEVKNGPSDDAETLMVIGAGRVIVEFGRRNGWVAGGVDRAGGIDGYVLEEAVSNFGIDGLPCGS